MMVLTVPGWALYLFLGPEAQVEEFPNALRTSRSYEAGCTLRS